MKPRHRVSRAAIVLIKRFEGYRRQAAQLPDGGWTIGYGHTLTARQGAEVSEEDAEALLLYDLIAVAHALNEWIYTPLTQNQFDALASFAFNIGPTRFRQSSVLKRINEGALIQAACAMELWRKADFEGERIVIDALVRRRAAEKALFLTPPGDSWAPAPSPVLKPELDADAMALVPQETPAPVSASLEGERTQVLRDETPSPGAPPEEPAASPAIAAAEAVTARLRTLFQEPAEAAAEPPFTLEPPSEAEEELGEPAVELVVSEVEEEVRGPDLFEEPAPANDLPEAFPSVVRPDGRPRVVIDDTAPFEYVPPLVQPLPKQPRGGLFALVLLAAVGLAFFAGGIYWALNGRTGAQGGLVSPLLVGWLAGLAGVGFFVAAAFLLLQRLGGASERSSRF